MNTALKVLTSPDSDPQPDSAVYLRARYLQSLEKELEDWVRKCEEAFVAGFAMGKGGKFKYWNDAFHFWIKERRENK